MRFYVSDLRRDHTGRKDDRKRRVAMKRGKTEKVQRRFRRRKCRIRIVYVETNATGNTAARRGEMETFRETRAMMGYGCAWYTTATSRYGCCAWYATTRHILSWTELGTCRVERMLRTECIRMPRRCDNRRQRLWLEIEAATQATVMWYATTEDETTLVWDCVL